MTQHDHTATQPPDELTWIQICQARSALRRQVDGLLRGSGLEIRELATCLVIYNPRDPDKGRIYITYTTSDVSHRLVTWGYLGTLRGYDGDDPDREPAVDAAAIITTLTSQPAPLE